MGFHGLANTEIVLELQLNSTQSMSEKTTDEFAKKPSCPSSADGRAVEPSLTLALSGDSSCACGAGTVGSSSISNNTEKREMIIREVVVSEELSAERDLGNTSHDGDHQEEYVDAGVNNPRKKLRLTKLQSGLLEKAFKLHTNLNLKQKQELARDLKLRPRQVEVWFQNRRARTKLKQTEVDCEYLKRCCKTLTDENQRLRQQVQQLKAQKESRHAASSRYPCRCQQPPSPCVRTSCERIGNTTSANSSTTRKTNPFTIYGC